MLFGLDFREDSAGRFYGNAEALPDALEVRLFICGGDVVGKDNAQRLAEYFLR